MQLNRTRAAQSWVTYLLLPGASRHRHTTRVIHCGDCLEQLRKLSEKCIDLVYISEIRRGGDPPFNSNHNYAFFWGRDEAEVRLGEARLRR